MVPRTPFWEAPWHPPSEVPRRGNLDRSRWNIAVPYHHVPMEHVYFGVRQRIYNPFDGSDRLKVACSVDHQSSVRVPRGIFDCPRCQRHGVLPLIEIKDDELRKRFERMHHTVDGCRSDCGSTVDPDRQRVRFIRFQLWVRFRLICYRDGNARDCACACVRCGQRRSFCSGRSVGKGKAHVPFKRSLQRLARCPASQLEERPARSWWLNQHSGRAVCV